MEFVLEWSGLGISSIYMNNSSSNLKVSIEALRILKVNFYVFIYKDLPKHESYGLARKFPLFLSCSSYLNEMLNI